MDKLYKIPYLENYLINKKGNVYNIKTKKFLKPLTSGRGYVFYIIYDKKFGRRSFFRHRLLCSVFKPVKNWEKLSVDHINGIPGDDRLENIEFVSIKENIQRYWKNKHKQNLKNIPIVIKHIISGRIYDCANYTEASMLLKVNRYEVLRRLSMPFGFVFKDYTMIKYLSDLREFPVYRDIKQVRELMQKDNKMKGYNHFTKEERVFSKMSDVCNFLNISPSTLTTKLQRSNKIFNSGWEFKHYYDNTPWSSISENLLKRIKNGNITDRPIEIKNINTKEVLIFKNCREACKYFNNGTPTKIWYRLKVNHTKPSKDGYLYNYL